jgi:hypothetical protein
MIPVIAIAGTGIALAMTYMSGPRNTVSVRASDGKSYQVQNLPDKQEAAERLASIRKKLTSVVDRFRGDANYENDPPYQRLIARYNSDVFSENDLTANSTSYSENKGERIVVCLRDKTAEPYPLIEENTVMFVLIHEMAHLMTESMGHTPEFWTNFRKLLHDCVQCGVYTPVNYAQFPVDYCGMTISDTPL